MNQFRYRIRRSGRKWGAWSGWLEWDGRTMILPAGVTLRNGDMLQTEAQVTTQP